MKQPTYRMLSHPRRRRRRLQKRFLPVEDIKKVAVSLFIPVDLSRRKAAVIIDLSHLVGASKTVNVRHQRDLQPVQPVAYRGKRIVHGLDQVRIPQKFPQPKLPFVPA